MGITGCITSWSIPLSSMSGLTPWFVRKMVFPFLIGTSGMIGCRRQYTYFRQFLLQGKMSILPSKNGMAVIKKLLSKPKTCRPARIALKLSGPDSPLSLLSLPFFQGRRRDGGPFLHGDGLLWQPVAHAATDAKVQSCLCCICSHSYCPGGHSSIFQSGRRSDVIQFSPIPAA